MVRGQERDKFLLNLSFTAPAMNTLPFSLLHLTALRCSRPLKSVSPCRRSYARVPKPIEARVRTLTDLLNKFPSLLFLLPLPSSFSYLFSPLSCSFYSPSFIPSFLFPFLYFPSFFLLPHHSQIQRALFRKIGISRE